MYPVIYVKPLCIRNMVVKVPFEMEFSSAISIKSVVLLEFPFIKFNS